MMKLKLDSVDKKIINYFSLNMPKGLKPFHTSVRRLDIGVEEILKRLKAYKKAGLLRKFGATLNHRKAGFKFNALGVWRVPVKKIDKAAKIMISYGEISHCYQRRAYPHWPYNLYTMIHTRKKSDCLKAAEEISRKIKVSDYRLLFSQKEYKKQGRIYFAEK